MLHEVASNAGHDEKKRRHVLCQFYDEVARREWSEKAARGDTEFILAVACQKLDRDILESARLEYDNSYAPRANRDGYEAAMPASAPKRNGKHSKGKYPRVDALSFSDQLLCAGKFAKSSGGGGYKKRSHDYSNSGNGQWGQYKKQRY